MNADGRTDGRTNSLIPFLSTKVLSWRIYVASKNKMSLRLKVKCRIFLSVFDQLWTLSTDFHISAHRQISRRPSNGSRADRRGHTNGQMNGQTATTKLIGAFRDHENAHRNSTFWHTLYFSRISLTTHRASPMN